MRSYIKAFVACVLISGCSAMKSNLNTNVSYLETAKQNFELGDAALADGMFAEAISYFDYVKNKFPYTQYAALADLRIADTYFAEEKWVEAADAYNLFVRFHPRHERVPYGMYQIGRSYYESMPKNFFLFPSASSKDQKSAHEALAALSKYLEQFPDDAYAPEATQMRETIYEQLAENDFFVGRFYQKRKRWKAAAGRYERVANLYPSTTLAPEALYEMFMIYRSYLNDDAEARRVYDRLIDRYPDSEFTKKAKKALP